MSSNPRLGFLGTDGGIPGLDDYDLATRLRIAGGNTGNFAFQRAAATLLTDERRYVGLSGVGFSDPAALDGVDYLIFPAANHLRLNADWSGLAGFFKASNLPIVVLGLGAQAPARGGDDESIHELTQDENLKRFVDVLADQAAAITVRGAFSKDVCAAFGLENTHALGCPSLFLNTGTGLGRRLGGGLASILDGDASAPVKFVLTAAAPWNMATAQKKAVERKLLEWLIAGDGLYVQQSGGPETVAFACGRFNEIKLSTALNFKKVLYPDGGYDPFITLMTTRQRLFWDVDQWRDCVEKFPLVLGTRLHGNMVGISAGVPSVFIAHDSRTSELVEIMKLPTVEMEAVESANSARDLLTKVDFNAADFDANRQEIAKQYIKLFDGLGLKSSADLARLSRTLDEPPRAPPQEVEAVDRE